MKHTNHVVTRTLYALLLAIILAEVLLFTAWLIKDTRDYAIINNIPAPTEHCIMPSIYE